MSECTLVINDLMARYPALKSIKNQIEQAASLLEKTVRQGGKILVCGNGGSGADADHIVGELMKSFIKPRPISAEFSEALQQLDPERGNEIARALQAGIPAICLTQHAALSTAYSNDVNPYMVFAQQTAVYGSDKDIFWGLSTSGNSKSVLYAAITAKAKGLKVLGMTGDDGGLLKDYCDVCIQVPESETYKVQELHLPVYHMLCMVMEQLFW